MIEVDRELVRAFHLMWDHYPNPSSLIHKSREVVAVNPACKSIPREVGSICAREQPAEKHRGCRANVAVETHSAQMTHNRRAGGTETLSFWLPIDGHPDFYIHFSMPVPQNPESL